MLSTRHDHTIVHRRNVQDVFFLVLIVALSAAFFRILTPYLVAIAVAVITAFLLRHPMIWMIRRGMTRGLATTITIVAFVLCSSIFVILVGTLLTNEIKQAVQNLRPELPKFLAWMAEKIPLINEQIKYIKLDQSLPKIAEKIASHVVNISQSAITGIPGTILRGIIVLYLVIFLLLDGERLVKKVYGLLPIDRTRVDELMEQATSTLDATMLGTLFIGVVEGIFGGILFAAFGFPEPLLWGLVMVIVSVLPLLGINVVIVPAGIIAILSGEVGIGLGFMAIGIAGSVISQNVLRPKLVGNQSGLHPAIVLLSTIGGLSWMGLVGFIIGPVIATLAMIAWEQLASSE